MSIENFPFETLDSPNKLGLLAQEMPYKSMDIAELDRPLGIGSVAGNAIDFVVENPGKSLLAVAATVATGGFALEVAPAIAVAAGEAGILSAAGTETAISTLSGDALSSASLASIDGGAQVIEGEGVVAGVKTIATPSIENFPLEKTESPNKLDLLAQEMPNKSDITELDRPLGVTQASRNEIPPVSGETREKIKGGQGYSDTAIEAQVSGAEAHIYDESNLESEVINGKDELINYTNFLPANNGSWEAGKGDSAWIPDDDFTPQKHNSENNTWGQIKEKYGFESIPFDKGEPDFSKVSDGTVEIEDFSTDRISNFTQADEKCAAQWTRDDKDGKSWSPDDVKAYRKEHELSWHERSDQQTMDLVPSIIHGNVAHSGGISAAKMEKNNE